MHGWRSCLALHRLYPITSQLSIEPYRNQSSLILDEYAEECIAAVNFQISKKIQIHLYEILLRNFIISEKLISINILSYLLKNRIDFVDSL